MDKKIERDEPGESLPSVVSINVPPSIKGKGFGFVRVGKQELKGEILDELSDDQVRELNRQVDRGGGLFIHHTSIEGLENRKQLEDVKIIPLKISQGEKGFTVSSAVTEKEYQSRQQAQIKKWKTEEEQQQRDRINAKDSDVLLEKLEELKLPFLNKADLQQIANSVSASSTYWDMNEEERVKAKLERVKENASEENAKKQFESEKPKLVAEAEKIAQEIGGEVSTQTYAVDVELREQEEVLKGYKKALEVDFKLAKYSKRKDSILERGKDEKGNDYGWIGKFTGVQIVIDNRDMGFVSERAANEIKSWDTYRIEGDEPNKPISSMLVWRKGGRRYSDINGLDEVPSFKEIFVRQKKWVKVAEDAENFLKLIEEDMAEDESEKEAAKDYILDLVKKIGIPNASPDNPINTTWLGMKLEANAWRDHTGRVGGSFTNHSCKLEIPGWGVLDLARPGDWPDDVSGAAKYIKEAWELEQPEGAVVPFETHKEAVQRLVSYPYDESVLPNIPGMKWELSHREAIAYSEEDSEDMPNLPTVNDENDNPVSHELILKGPEINEDLVVGGITFYKSKREPGYYAKVSGFPHYKIEEILESNPDLDPRLLRLGWKSIKTEKNIS